MNADQRLYFTSLLGLAYLCGYGGLTHQDVGIIMVFTFVSYTIFFLKVEELSSIKYGAVSHSFGYGFDMMLFLFLLCNGTPGTTIAVGAFSIYVVGEKTMRNDMFLSNALLFMWIDDKSCTAFSVCAARMLVRNMYCQDMPGDMNSYFISFFVYTPIWLLWSVLYDSTNITPLSVSLCCFCGVYMAHMLYARHRMEMSGDKLGICIYGACASLVAYATMSVPWYASIPFFLYNKMEILHTMFDSKITRALANALLAIVCIALVVYLDVRTVPNTAAVVSPVCPPAKVERIQFEKEECNLWVEKQHFFSQYGQDSFIYNIVKDYPPGLFVDLAAAWPHYLSNTYFLETCMGWSGLLIEGDPRKLTELVRLRSSVVAPTCVTEVRRTVFFGDKKVSGINKIEDKSRPGSFELTCMPFRDILANYSLPLEIDYMSLDIEGAEDMAIKSIGNYRFDMITIELYHLRNDKAKVTVILDYLEHMGYVPVIGFPTKKDNICSSSSPGNNLWRKTSTRDVLYDPKFNNGRGRMDTHDVLFVLNTSKYVPSIEKILDCK